MKVLIFGASGMLGHKLYQRLSEGFHVVGTVRETFSEVERFGIFDRSHIIEAIDVTDREAVDFAVETANPDIVINAVGIIKQRPNAKDRILTLSVNSIFPNYLAQLAESNGFRLITISTDCVFSGSRGGYTGKDTPDAHDLYGMSKLLGEVDAPGCLTLRTSIIGRELATTNSIVEWFLSNRGGSVNGYTRAIYTGLSTLEFADTVARLIAERPDLNGVYHVASETITKFDLLTLLNEVFSANIEIRRDDSVVIDRSLDATRFQAETGIIPPAWPEMVARLAADTTPYDNIRP